MLNLHFGKNKQRYPTPKINKTEIMWPKQIPELLELKTGRYFHSSVGTELCTIVLRKCGQHH